MPINPVVSGHRVVVAEQTLARACKHGALPASVTHQQVLIRTLC